jgi:type 2 lantibiotic biosynthesis protein LanM
MTRTTFPGAAWCRALRLTERIAARRATTPTEGNATVRTELGERRLQRWRAQAPFQADGHFARRLATDGVTEDEFLALLGEPIEAVGKRAAAPPAWVAELADAFARPAPAPITAQPRGQEFAGFLEAITPLLSQGRNRLHAGIQVLAREYSDLPFDPDTVGTTLSVNLPTRLLTMLGRTLILEMHVARLDGLLPGDTAEERFRSFVERLRQREHVLALFEEYPVLARQLAAQLQTWLAVSLEFLGHLCADWPALREAFSPGRDPGVLVQIEGGVGDLHRGGRSVQIVCFDSGFQVVYKPKSLAVDVHFQELLAWLNERGAQPSFRTLQILDRGDHGWVEFVRAAGCASADEVRRFYRRQGGYLALLYALEATDFHYENLIACGEHPVPIDLEALFHPRPQGMDKTRADHLAGTTLSSSVLRVGLLPQRLWFSEDSDGIDLSGLGAADGQLTPQPVPTLDGVGTDEMRVVRKRVTMGGGRHRPSLGGTEVAVLDHADEIVAGFTATYRLLLSCREELLSEAGPLASFAADEVRVILRPTRTYAMLLHESYHPDLLRDALDRDRFFDRLWAEVEHRPSLTRVIQAEREDLHNGDVPMFTTRPESRDLLASTGEPIADYFEEPGLALVRQRVLQLGEADLTRQLWFLRASLATLSTGVEQAPPPSVGPDAKGPGRRPRLTVDRERLLAAARAIGDRLEALALRGGDDATWIGMTLIRERHWALLPLGTDLYGGLPGVILFLAHLGALTGEQRYADLARAALTTLRRQLEERRKLFTAVGGFEGWGGVLYALTHLAALWNRPELFAEAEAVVDLLSPLIDRDEQLDVLGGSAGCLAALLALHHSAPKGGRALAAAVRCGNRLLARAEPRANGVGWVTRVPSAVPLTGFSHGAAGVAWALLELAAVTGEERFRTTARAAMAYERGLFCPEAGNWPDLRDMKGVGPAEGDGRASFMTAWCHGAAGIGLARLRSLKHLDDPATRAEIDAALRTTLAQGFGGNHCLCHGDLGNLELLLQASQTLGEPQWLMEAQRIAARILEGAEREGWLCGIPLRVETPGLMAGLAGIGYGLLRMAEPAVVPSVLVLAPPVGG